MKNTKIETFDATWSPVSGCLHGCEYCYARDITKRFGGFTELEDTDLDYEKICGSNIVELEKPLKYLNSNGDAVKAPYPFFFKPTLYRYKLDEPQKWKKGRNIFVCSMADLFGSWVPDSWIEEVFQACEKAPQHNYLFLTKNPKRYEKILDRYMPPNMWFGWTQTEPMGDKCIFEAHHSIKSFVSLEPLLKPFTEFCIRGIEWVIIGAETGRRKGKVVPERKWIEDIVNECRKENIPVFMKSSLAGIWEEPLIQEFPKELIRDSGRKNKDWRDIVSSCSCELRQNPIESEGNNEQDKF